MGTAEKAALTPPAVAYDTRPILNSTPSRSRSRVRLFGDGGAIDYRVVPGSFLNPVVSVGV